MFEHMKNYQALLRKISTWLKPNIECKSGEALVFVHIFCHKSQPYDFVEDDGWMAQNFFSGECAASFTLGFSLTCSHAMPLGGTMPSHDTLAYFQSDLTIIRSWWINGGHYGRTSEDWLKNQDRNAKEGIAELERAAVARGLPAEEGRKTFYRSANTVLSRPNYQLTKLDREFPGSGHSFSQLQNFSR